MKNQKIRKFSVSGSLLLLFIIFTVCVTRIDVQGAGPENSLIGFARFNLAVHQLTGVNLLWYDITDWMGLIPVVFAFILAVLGLCQLLRRRSFLKVDRKLLLMGGCYILIIGLYVFFEKHAINYRPVLLGKVLEPSYPSTHTMITMSILGTGIIFLKDYLKSGKVYILISALLVLVIAVTVIGRFISGVHWATDIIGGLLLSAFIISLYKTLCDIMEERI